MRSVTSRYVAIDDRPIDDKPIVNGLALALSAFETLAILPNGAGVFASCYDHDRRRP